MRQSLNVDASWLQHQSAVLASYSTHPVQLSRGAGNMRQYIHGCKKPCLGENVDGSYGTKTRQ